jgi:hypothetical protein
VQEQQYRDLLLRCWLVAAAEVAIQRSPQLLNRHLLNRHLLNHRRQPTQALARVEMARLLRHRRRQQTPARHPQRQFRQAL